MPVRFFDHSLKACPKALKVGTADNLKDAQTGTVFGKRHVDRDSVKRAILETQSDELRHGRIRHEGHEKMARVESLERQVLQLRQDQCFWDIRVRSLPNGLDLQLR